MVGKCRGSTKHYFCLRGGKKKRAIPVRSPLKERFVCASNSDMMQYCNFRLHVKAKLGIAYYYTTNNVYAVCSMYVCKVCIFCLE